jgi:hypothetical protein
MEVDLETRKTIRREKDRIFFRSVSHKEQSSLLVRFWPFALAHAVHPRESPLRSRKD